MMWVVIGGTLIFVVALVVILAAIRWLDDDDNWPDFGLGV